MASEQIKKLHVQYGHADVSTILRICRIANHPCDKTTTSAIVQECACGRSSGPQEKPVVSRYLTEYTGQTVAVDTFSPSEVESAKNPAIIMVCDYSRFVMAKFLMSSRPEGYIQFLVDNWAIVFGFPQTILCDNSTTFGGAQWGAICHIFDIQLLPAPTRASFQVGMVERHVGIIKHGYQALMRANSDHWAKTNFSPWLVLHATRHR